MWRRIGASPLAPRRRSVSPALTAHWAVIHSRARFDSPAFLASSFDTMKEPQRLLRFGGGEGNRTTLVQFLKPSTNRFPFMCAYLIYFAKSRFWGLLIPSVIRWWNHLALMILAHFLPIVYHLQSVINQITFVSARHAPCSSSF